MAAGSIYLVDEKGKLARMRPGAPTSEDKMQALVARYPELISDNDGDLLLVRREQPIGDAPEGSGRWSVDHLFVTRAAVPVLVELKRAVDTRLRREVVGQLLDYAANGVAYWQAGRIFDAFVATCKAAGEDADQRMRDFLGEDDPAQFWEQVDANFQAGRVKLVFVADVIPRELARIVEFLNDQMKADVRAVELKWFEGDGGVTTLAPRIIGETERAAIQKPGAKALAPITIKEWIDKNIAGYGDDAVRGASAYLRLVETLGGVPQVSNAQGSIIGVFKDGRGREVYPFHLWKDGGLVSLSFSYLGKRPGLQNVETRRSFVDEFTAIVGPLSTTNLRGFPGFKVAKLANAAVAEALAVPARRFIEAALATLAA